MSVVAAEFSPYQPGMPNYELSDPEMHFMTRSFLTQPEVPSGRFICAEFLPDDEMSNMGRSIERQVFEAAFGNDAEIMRQEYGPYEGNSRFSVVMDRKTQMPAGVIRAIEGTADASGSLKTLDDAESMLGIDAEEFKRRQSIKDGELIWDVGSLAVLPEYRGKMSGYEVSTLLYRAMFVGARNAGAKSMITIIDSKARRNLDNLGIPLKNVEGTDGFEYLGSKKSYFMHGIISELEEGARKKSEELKNTGLKVGNIIHPHVKEIVRRRVTARIAGQLATGAGLDNRIMSA